MGLINFGRLAQETAFVGRLLKKLGLPATPQEAIAALAKTIRDHRQLQRILSETGPEERQQVYDAIIPHLGFTADPLDVYIARAAELAERKQLPVVGPDGMLHEFKPASDAASLQKYAEDVLNDAAARRFLILTCSKCTAEQAFPQLASETNVDVILKARKAGWVYDYLANPPVEICPKCPTSLRLVN